MKPSKILQSGVSTGTGGLSTSGPAGEFYTFSCSKKALPRGGGEGGAKHLKSLRTYVFASIEGGQAPKIVQEGPPEGWGQGGGWNCFWWQGGGVIEKIVKRLCTTSGVNVIHTSDN